MRVCAIGVALLFAQIHEEACGGRAAEDGVHDERGEVVGVCARDAVVGDDDIGLRGAGAVDDVRRAAREFGRDGEVRLRDFAARPGAEQLFDARE